MNLPDLDLLHAVFDAARKARTKGNHPFGALLVDEDELIQLKA